MKVWRAVAMAVVAAGCLVAVPARAAVDSRRALYTTVSELNADGIGLGKAIDYLRETTGANIVVNWKVLEAVGVDRTTPISLNVRELPLRKMLQLALDQASPNAQLVYTVEENVIQVTTQEDADKAMITKVYVVDDLVMVPRQSSPPSLNLGSSVRSGTGGGGSSSGTGLFGSDSGNNQNNQVTSQMKGEELVTLIREVVRPTIWRENGGTASIRYFAGKLIVTAPASVHEAIGGPVNSKATIRYGS